MFALTHSFRSTFVFSVFAAALVLGFPGSHHTNARQIARHHDGHLRKRFSNSKWTWFPPQPNACGSTDHEGDWYIAVNIPQWDDGSHCYQPITLHYAGKTATAKVTDQCVGCPPNGLDLSPALFDYLVPGGTDIGVIYDGTWEFGGNTNPAPPPKSQDTPEAKPKPTSTPPPPPPPPPKTSSSTTTKKSTTTTKESSSTSISTSTRSTTTTSTTSTSTSTTSTSTTSPGQPTATVMDNGNINQFNLVLIQLAGLSDVILASPNDF